MYNILYIYLTVNINNNNNDKSSNNYYYFTSKFCIYNFKTIFRGIQIKLNYSKDYLYIYI